MNYSKVKKQLEIRLGDIENDKTYFVDLLFDALQRYCEAEKDVKKNKQVIKANQRSFINPSVNIINESHKQIVRLLEILGIKPDTIIEQSDSETKKALDD